MKDIAECMLCIRALFDWPWGSSKDQCDITQNACNLKCNLNLSLCMTDGLIDKEAHFIQHKRFLEKEKILLMNEFDLGKRPDWAKQTLSTPLIFCPYPLFGVLTMHKNVFWKYIVMMATGRPHPLQLKLTKISETQTCNGPDWPGGQNKLVELFIFSIKISWRKQILKKLIKWPLLFQSNRKRVWK